MPAKKARPRIKPIIAGILATIPPIALFLLSHRRESKIAFYFLRFELYEHRITMIFSLVLLILLIGGGWIFVSYTKGPSMALLLARMMTRRVAFQVMHRNAFLSLALLGLMLAASIVHFRLHYRIFSEVYYPLNAKKAFVAGDYFKARAICDLYLQLYPQRAENGAVEDPVCWGIGDFSRKMGLALKYFRSQKDSGRRSVAPILSAPEARAATIELLQRFSGE